jgi:MYXO-CTERM domain-containing protein
MMLKQLGLAAAVLAAVGSGSASASVRHDFTGSYSDPFYKFTGSFTYVVPTFITSNTGVTPGSLSSCSVDVNGPATCHEVASYPAASPSSGDQIDFFGERRGSVEGFRFGAFDDMAFVSPSRHGLDLLSGALAQLTASILPEPDAWTFVLLGLGGLGVTIRRRHDAIRRLL